MKAIVLGKSLLPADELFEFAFSELNTKKLTLKGLQKQANYAATDTSIILIKLLMSPNQSNHPKGLSKKDLTQR